MNRYMVQKIGFGVLILSAIAVVAPIMVVVGIIFVEGARAVSWEFISAMPFEGMKEGGIFPR